MADLHALQVVGAIVVVVILYIIYRDRKDRKSGGAGIIKKAYDRTIKTFRDD